ncbi:hypothetical protein OJF2_39770 [Aquisphaera giovannonii]|uniref:DUF433 domain-containing protein n=1 Tax=Aquisphaera giovannonii TaxID=406548 RepID=A0A5B9W5N1_9BACT|nr:DUF433 domain-containing protein [Aquisphaera giovannonii]QEH35425.1 hypothetical protein OJF2_39770 [Aquisphaera giovannonii]
MSTTIRYPHLVEGADGAVRIDGTRYKVLLLAGEHFHYGWSAEEILRQHPDLRPEQVYAALTYFYDHHEAMVADMTDASGQIGEGVRKSAISRAVLLERWAARGS